MARNENVDGRGPGQPFRPERDRHPVVLPDHVLSALLPELHLIQTVIGGTDSMRAAGKDMLPQFPYEEREAYEDRLMGAVLDNYTERALGTWVGKAFAEPPELDEDVPDGVAQLMEDVDLGGTGLVPFAREFFASGLRDRDAYVLVDHTAGPPRADGQPRTLEDDRRDNLRPFWRLVPACDMLEVRRDGQGRVTMARFRDDEMRPAEPFGSYLVERVKVVRPGTWEVWEQVEKGKDKEWRVVDSGPYDAPEVRLVKFSTGRKPPLLDLAHINRRHWISTAEQNNILTVTRFPMLGASGVKPGQDDQLVVGPRKFLTTPDPQGKIYYVEHSGAAVSSGKDDLERLEARMAEYAGEFMKKTTGGPESASGRVLDEGTAISPLRSWVLDFRDALEVLLQFTAQWLKLGDDAGGSVLFDMDDGEELLDQGPELTFLSSLRTKGDIDQKGILEEAKRRGVLPEDFDVEATISATDDEKEKAQEQLLKAGPIGGMFGGDKPAKSKAPPPAK